MTWPERLATAKTESLVAALLPRRVPRARRWSEGVIVRIRFANDEGIWEPELEPSGAILLSRDATTKTPMGVGRCCWK